MIWPKAICVVLGLSLLATLGALAMAASLLSRLSGELRLARALELAPAALALPDMPAWNEQGLRVLVAGDSRVALWAPEPDLPGVDLRYAGIGGETTIELRRRLERDLPLYAPDRLVLAAGVNDLTAASRNPAHARQVAIALVENLRAIIMQARAAGVEVTLLTIPQAARPDPLRRALFWSDGIYGLIAETNIRIRALEDPAAGVTVLDAAALIGGAADEPLPARFAADTLHFNAEAYARLNEVLSGDLRE